MYDEFPSRVPWNWQPHLNEMCQEVGVDYDQFIEGLANKKSDSELAETLKSNVETIQELRNHFENFGIGSVLGQD